MARQSKLAIFELDAPICCPTKRKLYLQNLILWSISVLRSVAERIKRYYLASGSPCEPGLNQLSGIILRSELHARRKIIEIIYCLKSTLFLLLGTIELISTLPVNSDITKV